MPDQRRAERSLTGGARSFLGEERRSQRALTANQARRARVRAPGGARRRAVPGALQVDLGALPPRHCLPSDEVTFTRRGRCAESCTEPPARRRRRRLAAASTPEVRFVRSPVASPGEFTLRARGDCQVPSPAAMIEGGSAVREQGAGRWIRSERRARSAPRPPPRPIPDVERNRPVLAPLQAGRHRRVHEGAVRERETVSSGGQPARVWR